MPLDIPLFRILMLSLSLDQSCQSKNIYLIVKLKLYRRLNQNKINKPLISKLRSNIQNQNYLFENIKEGCEVETKNINNESFGIRRGDL